MTRKLQISDTLSLPIDAATQTFAFIGRKGSGKTYAAGKLTELLIDAGVQVIVLDLVGKWWGLRLAADGKGPGIDIPMFGGLRGDMPLEAAGGAIIADALLESGRSALLDLSQFSKSGRQEFAYRCGQKLWQAQKAQLNPVPVHLVIEESQLIVPENIPAGGKGEFLREMYGVFEEIIRLGRNYGIGITLITQRPQSVAKEVLNQSEPLLVFQLTGKHERKAIKEWIQHQGMDEDLTDTLPALKKGECWFWSPEWLEELKQIKIAPKWTFDSTATPKVGDKRPKARAIKPLDLSDLQAKMAATIERAKADDPKELRATIKRLEREKAELEKRPAIAATPPVKEKRVEVPVLKGKQVDRLVKNCERMIAEAERHGQAMNLFWKNQDELNRGLLDALRALAGESVQPALKVVTPPSLHGHKKASVSPESKDVKDTLTLAPKRSIPEFREPVNRPPREAGQAENGQELGKAERTILTAAYWIKDEDATESKLAFYSGYSSGSSTWDRALGTLRKGLMQKFSITEAGIQLVESWGVKPKPAGTKLRAMLRPRLTKAENELLDQLIAAYPQTLMSEDLAAAAKYSTGSSTWDRSIGTLRKIEAAIGYDRDGGIKAADVFFAEGEDE